MSARPGAGRARARAGVAKGARAGIAKGAAPGRDFGPAIRLAGKQGRGGDDGPDPRRAVVKEFRPDPDAPGAPLVRGGRVRDPLRRMHESGQISKGQWDGVEAFRDDVDLSRGARTGGTDSAGVRVGPSNRNWPSDVMLDAWRRVARAMRRFTPVEGRLVVWTVVEYRSLRSFTRAEGMRDETGSQMLQRVLDQLAQRRGRSGRDSGFGR